MNLDIQLLRWSLITGYRQLFGRLCLPFYMSMLRLMSGKVSPEIMFKLHAIGSVEVCIKSGLSCVANGKSTLYFFLFCVLVLMLLQYWAGVPNFGDEQCPGWNLAWSWGHNMCGYLQWRKQSNTRAKFNPCFLNQVPRPLHNAKRHYSRLRISQTMWEAVIFWTIGRVCSERIVKRAMSVWNPSCVSFWL